MNDTVKIELELSRSAVERIERLAEADIRSILEDEINTGNGETFIEMMGYDNW